METAMADDEWTEVDTEATAPEEDKVEYELEEATEPEEKETVFLEKETVVEVDEDSPDPDPVESAPELAGVETDGAQKRIRQLVRQRKEREEQIIAQQMHVAALEEKLQQTEQKNAEVFKKNYDVTEHQLKEKTEMARQQYLRAYDDGDKEAMLSAQEAMMDARQNISLVKQGRQDVEKYSAELVKQAEAYNNQQVAQPQQKAFDPKAVDWAENNTWFGQDQVATAAALAIDATLKNEGYDPSDDGFYKEVDKRLRSELPNKFGAAPASVTQEQVVGGQSRKSPGSVGKKGNRKVKLTSADIGLANKWNIPLERYAKEKAKADKATATGDYTSINVG
jgi:AraC-like DNA-binding protein